MSLGRHHHNRDYPDHPAPGGAHYERREERENRAPRDDSRRNPRDYPNRPAPGGSSTMRPKSFREKVRDKLRERFHEHEATPEEVEQLELNAKREKARTSIKKSKHEAREYGFWGKNGGFGGSGRGRNRGSSGFSLGDSLLDSGFGGGKGGGFGHGLDDMLGSGGGFGMGGRKKKKGSSGFGSGLNDMLGF